MPPQPTETETTNTRTMVSFRLTMATRATLRQLATETGCTQTATLEAAIRQLADNDGRRLRAVRPHGCD